MTRPASPPTRRALLRLASGLGLLAALPATPLAATPDGPGLAQRLAGIFRHRDSAARIGARYLAQHPGEADIGRLVSRILPDPDQRRQAERSDPPDVHGLLRQRIAADFATARTACVEGWILSETEARLMALAHLSAAASQAGAGA